MKKQPQTQIAWKYEQNIVQIENYKTS